MDAALLYPFDEDREFDKEVDDEKHFSAHGSGNSHDPTVAICEFCSTLHPRLPS